MPSSSEDSRPRHINQAESHPDFQIPWVQSIFKSPGFSPSTPKAWEVDKVSNTMFDDTLSHATGLKAYVFFSRPCPESTSITGEEDCYVLSVGHGVDGAAGRAHGGFNSLMLDHITGGTAHRVAPSEYPPATAYLNVQYKNPVGTPCVLLVRSWATKIEGRKVFLKGSLEDGFGKVFASAEALFISPRPTAKTSL